MKNKNVVISWLINFELKDDLNYISLGNFKICTHNYAYKKFPNNINPEKKDYNDYFLIYETNEEITEQFENETFVDIIENFFKVLFYYRGIRIIARPEYAPFYQSDKSINIYRTGMEISSVFKSNSSTTQNDYFEICQDFYEKIGNNKKISNYIDTAAKTIIERKIHLAVNWIGNSLDNRNLIEGYTQLCIALETLLSGESSPLERGTAYQLREYGAFLCSTNKEERIQYYKKIKKLYSIRCSITHQGISTKLTEKHFYELLNILKMIIHKLYILLNEEQVDTFAKLTNYIDNMKFE